MMKVANRACVRKVAIRSLKAAKMRNWIAVIAIILTTVMFTALFTIGISVNDSFQQSNFLMVGGDDHGDFKNLTKEQMDKLKKDPLVKEANARWFLGVGTGDAFRKANVEVSYMDKNAVKHYFCTPKHGRIPKEGTNEAMTDTRVLKLLGVTPKVGAKFTLTYQIGEDAASSKTVTKEFVLSGWWDFNESSPASQVIVPKSYVKEMLQGVDIRKGESSGYWTLGVMFSNSRQIEKKMQQILKNCGFQSEDDSQADYIGYGVNWGYTSAQTTHNMDMESIIGVVLLLLLIVFTGYLIIYNVFQISVTNDIRFYGLLKTIGMTGRQMKQIIRIQAVVLAGIGIPFGLLGGFGIGACLAPEVMKQMNYNTAVIRLHAWVFVLAALFSLITVVISCNKPGKIAAKVSPVEAVCYTEADPIRRKTRKETKPASLMRMAWGNILRNRKKAILVFFSLSLAVVLLNLTVMFANGFDMERYLKKFCSSDFQFANADYFNVQKGFSSAEQAVEDSVMQTVLSREGILHSGCVYGQTGVIQEKIDKKDILSCSQAFGSGMSKEEMKMYLQGMEQSTDGKYYDQAQVYGMDDWPLEKLQCIKGDMSKLNEKDTIAAVYSADDYDRAIAKSNWAKVGDQVTLRYVDSFKYYDRQSGKEIPESAIDNYNDAYVMKADHYTEKTYTVAAEVIIPDSMDYRYYSNPGFVLKSDTFVKDSGTKNVMHMMFDMKNNETARNMEQFLKQYTEQVNPIYDYESKFLYEKDFASFRTMFLVLGSTLSGVIAIVGILNFLNAILTGMIARRREFAVMQAIGMTRRQLKRMLVYEGMLYTLAASILSLLFVVWIEPLAGKILKNMFWFFRFHYTIWPVLLAAVFFTLIGVAAPGILYHFTDKTTIVDRLKQTE